MSDSDEESTVGHPNEIESKSDTDSDSVHQEQEQEEGVMEDHANAIEPEVEAIAEIEEDESPAIV